MKLKKILPLFDYDFKVKIYENVEEGPSWEGDWGDIPWVYADSELNIEKNEPCFYAGSNGTIEVYLLNKPAEV